MTLELGESIRGILNEIAELRRTMEIREIATPEDLAERSKSHRELTTLRILLCDATEKLTVLVEQEKAIIETYVRKTEENLVQVRKMLYSIPKPAAMQPTVMQPAPFQDEEESEKPSRISWADIAATQGESSRNHSPIKQRGIFTIPRGTRVGRQVAHQVPIEAYTIENPEGCLLPEYAGWFCYCTSTGKFYIAINGFIMGGNTTNILSETETPYKFSEHRACSESSSWNIDPATVKFWVRPLRRSSPRDQRVLTNRMKFHPASQEPGKKDKYIYRLGSKDTLPKDLNAMDKDMYYLNMDIMMNFLLTQTAAAAVMNTRGELNQIFL
jgi:hypothetical protein